MPLRLPSLLMLLLLVFVVKQACTLRSSMNGMPDNRTLVEISRIQSPSAYLDPLLVPRPPLSQNLTNVQHFIVETLLSHGWTVEFDNSTLAIPDYPVRGTTSNVQFTNIIATQTRRAAKYIVLSAHYESKSTPEGFIGATDSAAPCAILLQLAHALKDTFRPNDALLSTMLVFFDGEEAFKAWTVQDSTYGSRNLAKVWKDMPSTSSMPGDFQPSFQKTAKIETRIDQIDLFILLDLLGSKNPWPMIPNYYTSTTSVAYQYLMKAEQTLLELGELSKLRQGSGSSYFTGKSVDGNTVDDDHRPFKNLDVPILHIIPRPFPNAWHTIKDDASTLDMDIISDFSKILRVFVFKYVEVASFTGSEGCLANQQ